MPSSYTLGSRFETLIRDLLAAGRYNNASEIIRDGLRMVEERERRLASLDAAIARGIADADSGRTHTTEDLRAEMHESFRRDRRSGA